VLAPSDIRASQYDTPALVPERSAIGSTARDASQPSGLLPQSRLRMGPELDSATLSTSAALSGYAYAYRYAWRFS
jgi:hypothetical protein